MALAVLSPFPPTTAAVTRAAAIACLKASMAEAGGLTDDRVAALGEAAAAAVERFAPGAPQAAKNEAVIRFAGWLHASAPRAQRQVSIDTIRIQFARHVGSNGLARSGARDLLAPWRVRRALPVEDAS